MFYFMSSCHLQTGERTKAVVCLNPDGCIPNSTCYSILRDSWHRCHQAVYSIMRSMFIQVQFLCKACSMVLNKHDNIYQVKQVRTCRRCKIWGVQASPLVPFKVLAFYHSVAEKRKWINASQQTKIWRTTSIWKLHERQAKQMHLSITNHQTHLGLPRIWNVVSVPEGAAALSSPNWILSIIFCVSWKTSRNVTFLETCPRATNVYKFLHTLNLNL